MKKLLENLDSKIKGNVSTRRYSLSDMISESYKVYYESAEDSNMQKLAESHLADVRKNPADIERLSQQLCKIKHLKSMIESKKLGDEELLVPEEKYTKVDPPEEKEGIKESTVPYTWGDYQNTRGTRHRVKFYSRGQDMTNQIVGCIYEPYIDGDEYGAEIYDNSDDSSFTTDIELFDTEDKAIAWVEDWFRSNLEESAHDEDVEEKEDEDLLEDSELTDEEVAELEKHLSEIRKNKKVSECDTPVKESKGRKLKRRVNEADNDFYTPTKEEADKVVNLIKKKYGNQVGEQDYIDTLSNIIKKDNISTDIIDYACEKAGIKITETKSWDKISLNEFSKKSASKAFVRTFKKLDKKLHEGTALTRQEAISLYKAANSAMTHLSVELEHNPEFLPVFNESTSLLSKDVNRLLESMKNGKAPSKATMKSLAKFSEALLREDEEEDLPPIEDEEDFVAEEGIPMEDEETPEEEAFTEDTEEFDQEYADARIELHNELAEENADDENPEVQEKLAQDAEEIMDLPGTTDEQRADLQDELSGEDTPTEDTEEEEAPEEEVEENIDPSAEEDDEFTGEIPPLHPHKRCDKCNNYLTDAGECPVCDHGEEDIDDSADITDDELAELKKYLMEMRKTKKSK